MATNAYTRGQSVGRSGEITDILYCVFLFYFHQSGTVQADSPLYYLQTHMCMLVTVTSSQNQSLKPPKAENV